MFFEPKEVRGPVGRLSMWLAGEALDCLSKQVLDDDDRRVCDEMIREAELVRSIYARYKYPQVDARGYGPLLSPTAYHYLMLFREGGEAAGFGRAENLADIVAETVVDVLRRVQLGQPMQQETRTSVFRFLAEVRERTRDAHGMPMCAVPLHGTPYYDDSD